jgi:hypothetical protein
VPVLDTDAHLASKLWAGLTNRLTTLESNVRVSQNQSQTYRRGAHIFQNSRGHLIILGARRVTRSKFQQQTLGATVKNLVTKGNWRHGFVHPCLSVTTTGNVKVAMRYKVIQT